MTSAAASELVPIADRLRYLQIFRFVLAAVVALVGFLERDSLDVPPAQLALATGGYLGLSLLGYVVWRLVKRAGLALFGGLLIADGVFLAAASYGTGGAESPIRYLIILHLIAVALLASHRTGMKLALWHSLLLLVVHYAEDGGWLPADAASKTSFGQILAFSHVFWFDAVVTASFSAINERELRRRRYDLEALAQMARRLEQVSGSGDVAGGLLEDVCETFDIERGAILAAPSDGVLAVVAHRGEVVEDALVVPHDDSVLTVALRSRQSRLASHLDPAADADLLAALPDARNVVIVPLSAERQAIGALVVEHPMRAGSRIERRVLGMMERFAAHGALALRNAWLLEQVQHLAATDGLTGLANRSTFQRTLGQEIARSGRNGGDLAVVLLDLDHFKRVNDTYGHHVGDEVLRRGAAVLDDTCRGFDTPARFGGEEFAVVLPQTTPSDAVAVAERLRAEIAAADIDPKVTVSIGVASLSLVGADADDLVRAADEALYASKREGRNRVTVAGGPQPLTGHHPSALAAPEAPSPDDPV